MKDNFEELSFIFIIVAHYLTKQVSGFFYL